MEEEYPLDKFISRLAHKIAVLYPNNCADEEDYIQAGHLKLIEINNSDGEKQNLIAYAIVSISRAMRETALDAMGAASAPNRIKKLSHKVKILALSGKTEREIKQELDIDSGTLASIKSLSQAYSWHDLFLEPSHEQEPFCVVDDILSSSYLDKEDKMFILSQFDDMDNFQMTRKQRWIRSRRIRHKLTRSGYGT